MCDGQWHSLPLYSGRPARFPERRRAGSTCVSRLQIADGTSNKDRGWINGTQVVRINVRRSRTDAGVWENPGSQFQDINQMRMLVNWEILGPASVGRTDSPQGGVGKDLKTSLPFWVFT